MKTHAALLVFLPGPRSSGSRSQHAPRGNRYLTDSPGCATMGVLPGAARTTRGEGPGNTQEATMRMLFVVNDSVIGDLTTEVSRIELKLLDNGRWDIRLFDLRDLYCGGGTSNVPLRWISKNLKEIT